MPRSSKCRDDVLGLLTPFQSDLRANNDIVVALLDESTELAVKMNGSAKRCAYTNLSHRLTGLSKRSRQFSISVWRYEKQSNAPQSQINVEELLSNPTWSVSSLLPPKYLVADKMEISSKRLHHLLRLSALPPPKDMDEEARMLSTLSSQLHFVKEIQKVDTTGVEPLRSLRDETAAGEKEAELGMDALKDALDGEELRGKHHKRIRRRRDQGTGRQEEKWDVLGTTSSKVGRFFVVDGGKER